MKNKILVLSNQWDGKCVTGGHFYEDNMFRCMLENPNVEIKRFSVNRTPTLLNKILAPLLNLQFISKCIKYDLIIITSVLNWYFILLAFSLKLYKKPKLLIIHHHFAYKEFTGIKKSIFRILELNFLKISDYLITVSPYIYDLCKNKFPNKNLRYWPIPFSDKIINCENKTIPGQLTYMGTVEPRKGLIYLLKALVVLEKENIHVNLNIIGKIKDSQYYEDLINIINQNRLNVNFLGFVDDKTKDLRLKETDIFVFPSLLEGYGMVLREVMSYGLPVVCFNNSAMPYLVENRVNGLVVENKNHNKLAEAISTILQNKKIRDSLSTGAYNTTKKTITHNGYRKLLLEEVSEILE